MPIQGCIYAHRVGNSPLKWWCLNRGEIRCTLHASCVAFAQLFSGTFCCHLSLPRVLLSLPLLSLHPSLLISISLSLYQFLLSFSFFPSLLSLLIPKPSLLPSSNWIFHVEVILMQFSSIDLLIQHESFTRYR